MTNSVTTTRYRVKCIPTYAGNVLLTVLVVTCFGFQSSSILLLGTQYPLHYTKFFKITSTFPDYNSVGILLSLQFVLHITNTCITAQIIGKQLGSTINASYANSEGSQSNPGRQCYSKWSFLWCPPVPYENSNTASQKPGPEKFLLHSFQVITNYHYSILHHSVRVSDFVLTSAVNGKIYKGLSMKLLIM
jgi:hypothetical protein